MYPFLEESLFLVGIMLSILFFRMQRLSVKIEISHYLGSSRKHGAYVKLGN